MQRVIQLVVLLLVVTHLVTLSKSPVPWFDETYFASLCKSLAEGRGFNADVCPLMEAHYPQAKAYGPGYLMINAALIKIFGLDIFVNRTIALVGGLGALWVWSLLAGAFGTARYFILLGVAAMLCDSVFTQSLHSGRMDTLALCCMLSAIYFSKRLLDCEFRSQWRYLVAAGMSSAYCLLTSPRPAIILVAYWAGYFVVNGFETKFKIWYRAVAIAAMAGAAYFIWIWAGFGGWQAWYNYFFAPSPDPVNNEMNTLVSMYVGKRFYVPAYQWLVIVPAIVALPFTWRAWSKPILAGMWASLLSFYSLIIDTGMYSVLILPLWYFMFIFNFHYLIQSNWKYARKVSLPAMYAVALVMLGGFLLKLLFIFITWPERNQSALLEFCKKFIPQKSKVVGEDKFYYGVVNAGSDFQYLIRGSHGERRRDYHFHTYNFEYLLVSAAPDENHRWHKDYYGEWAEWQEVARFTPVQVVHPWRKLAIDIYLKQFPTLAFSLEGVLYRRIDKPQQK